MKNIFLLLLSFIIINGFNSYQIVEAQEPEKQELETGKVEDKGTPFGEFEPKGTWAEEETPWQKMDKTLFEVVSEWQTEKFTEFYKEIQKLEEELNTNNDPAEQEKLINKLETKRQELQSLSETALRLMWDQAYRYHQNEVLYENLASAIEKMEDALRYLYTIYSRFNLKPDVELMPSRDYNPFNRDYDQLRENDPNRPSILDQSRKRYSESTCEELDDRNHDCVKQCREIYGHRIDRDDCEELPIAQIAVLADIHELLEDPDDDELASIDLEDLEVYLNISIDGFDSHINKYSKIEAKEVLFWIAENENISNLFSNEDDYFKALEKLFNEVVGGSFSPGSDTHLPFITRIDGSDKLMGLVIDSGNEAALKWFHSYITEKAEGCTGDNDEVSLECFSVFCKIGKDIDDEIP